MILSFLDFASVASDLDCIRALFNEKEKELSLAVAKVEELTRQLEELRGRQNVAATGTGSGTGGGVGAGGVGGPGGAHLSTPASAELEKLRRELMVSSLTFTFFEYPYREKKDSRSVEKNIQLGAKESNSLSRINLPKIVVTVFRIVVRCKDQPV